MTAEFDWEAILGSWAIRDRIFGLDEGFGSLSEDTLEEALDVLDELRNDRIIGIISHVQGMKSLVPARLEVRPTNAGPSTTALRVVGQV